MQATQPSAHKVDFSGCISNGTVQSACCKNVATSLVKQIPRFEHKNPAGSSSNGRGYRNWTPKRLLASHGSKTPPGIVLGTRNCPWISNQNILSTSLIKNLVCVSFLLVSALRRRSESPIRVGRESAPPLEAPQTPQRRLLLTRRGVLQAVARFVEPQEPIMLNRIEIHDWFRKIDITVRDRNFLLWVCV